MDLENYKQIYGFNDYMVDKYGNVISVKNTRTTKQESQGCYYHGKIRKDIA